MAFKMNRPLIEGTKNHKASVAKAKEAKANVLDLSKEMEKVYTSNAPHLIDYGLKMPEIKLPGEEEEDDNGGGNGDANPEAKKKETKEQKAARLAQEQSDQARKNARENQRLREENKPDTTVKPIEAKNEGEQVSGEKYVDEKEVVTPDVSEKKSGRLPTYDEAWDMNKGNVKGKYKDKNAYKDDMKRIKTEEKGGERDVEREEKRKEAEKGGGEGNISTNSNGGDSKGSAVTKRDNRIWRNAKIGGPVRKKMLKNGYQPK